MPVRRWFRGSKVPSMVPPSYEFLKRLSAGKTRMWEMGLNAAALRARASG